MFGVASRVASRESSGLMATIHTATTRAAGQLTQGHRELERSTTCPFH